MSHVLQATAAFEATDLRDKIYESLGIVQDQKSLELEPDYEISTSELYTKVTRQVLFKEHSLQLLEAAGLGWPRSLTQLSSWCPDYTNLDKMIMALCW